MCTGERQKSEKFQTKSKFYQKRGGGFAPYPLEKLTVAGKEMRERKEYSTTITLLLGLNYKNRPITFLNC